MGRTIKDEKGRVGTVKETRGTSINGTRDDDVEASVELLHEGDLLQVHKVRLCQDRFRGILG